MVNFQKIFRHGPTGYAGAIEFRVFAGTVSLNKILHHLATVLGLCRRASEVQCLGAFKKNKLQTKRTASASCGGGEFVGGHKMYSLGYAAFG